MRARFVAPFLLMVVVIIAALAIPSLLPAQDIAAGPYCPVCGQDGTKIGLLINKACTTFYDPANKKASEGTETARAVAFSRCIDQIGLAAYRCPNGNLFLFE